MKPLRLTSLLVAALTLGLLCAGCGGGGTGLFQSAAGSGSTSGGTSGSGSSGSGSSGSGSSGTGTVSTPTITAVAPASEMAGATGQTLTITGTGFTAGATVTFNGQPETVSSVTATSIAVAIANADLLAGGTFALVVTNADGGTVSFNYPVINPPPVLTSLSPASVTAGALPMTLTLTGTGFNPSTTATFNGSNALVTYVSATQISFELTQGELATAGTDPVIVTNPGPGGGASAAVNFTVSPIVNPPPTLTAISPASLTAGAAPTTLTLTGTGFNGATVASFNGNAQTTTLISSTQVSILLSAGELATAGVMPVVVSNPTPGGGASGVVNFVLDNPTPAITSFSPTTAPVGASSQTLTITGTGFVSGSQVTWNGAARQTTFISSTNITAALLQSDLAVGGNVSVAVDNPSPGGGNSAPVAFTVANPAPTVTAVAPTAMLLGESQTLTITGAEFVAGATVMLTGPTGAETLAPSPSAISSSQIEVSVPAADLLTAGSYTIAVANPTPGGGSSASTPLTVNYPPPTLTSMLPVSSPVNAPAPITLTLGGTGFNSATTVSFNGTPLAGTPDLLPSGEQMTVQIPASDLAQSGIFPVTVTNPSPGGTVSNALYFSVGSSTSSPAGIAVVPEEVDQPSPPGGGPQTLDVAYLPLPPAAGSTNAEIDIVQLDTIDLPPFLPINGFVTDASPYSIPGTAGSTFVNVPNTVNHTAVLNRIIIPDSSYTPDATVYDGADNVVLVSSITSAKVYVISVASSGTPIDPTAQAITNSYTVPGITGSYEFSDYQCSGICDLSIDQSGISGHAGAWAMAPTSIVNGVQFGLLHFNPTTGTILSSPTYSGVALGPDFGYASTGSAWNLLNPYYTEQGTAGLQFLNLENGGTPTALTNPVGTRPTSAVIDPATQLSVVADEGTGEDFLLNLFQPPSGATGFVPSTGFYVGSGGVNCQTRPDWTMNALDFSSHTLLAGQVFAGCAAVMQLPVSADETGGTATTPTAPATVRFGPVSAPQSPYQVTPPWGALPFSQLDPDDNLWCNGGDPFRFAIYSSVLTGQPTALFLERADTNPLATSCPAPLGGGLWLAEIPLASMLNESNASSVGELTPTQMAELTAFIRVRVPTPVVNAPSEVAQGTTVTTVTLTGYGFVGSGGTGLSGDTGTVVTWDGDQVPVLVQTPTSLEIDLQPAQMTLGNHTITVTTPAFYGSVGGSTSFTIVVVPAS